MLRPPKPAAKQAKPTSSKGTLQKKKPSMVSSKKETPASRAPAKAPKRTEWAMPSFSILPKKPKEKINWDDVKKKMIRRQAPEGEDIKAIGRIMKELQGKKIPVHDFINLVSAYTGDNGHVLRQILEEDVDSFRKLARRVYETQTQDVSDVLVNEQLQLVNFYQEKHDIFTEKMMNAINEIFEIAPNFDFDRYYSDKEDYLNSILPLPAEITKAPEELEMQRRQMAYHRLQWLRTEGERMHEENVRLQRRLERLKAEQKEEQARMAEVAAQREEERQKLAQQETQMQDRLQELNENVEQSIIENEVQLTTAHRQEVMQPSTGAVKKTASGVRQKKGKAKKKRPEWVSEVAAEIEDQAVREVLAVEAEAAQEPPPASRRRRMMMRPRTAQQPQQPAGEQPPRQTSPFHFSPERVYAEPQPTQRDVRVESHAHQYQERRSPAAAAAALGGPGRSGPPRQGYPQPGPPQQGAPQQQGPPQPAPPQQFRGRRGQAPKDTWGGF